MRHTKIILLTLAVLLLLTGAGTWALWPDIRNWGGSYLLSLIQGQVNGKVTAKEISGNPVTGFTFKDLELTGPDGQTVLTADRLEVRLSLSTVTAFHLDLGTLALVKPRVHLYREKSGQWNLSNLVKEAEKPAQPPGLADKIIAYFLREIELSSLVIQQGEVVITEGSASRRYTNLELNSSLTLLNWGQPQQQARVNLRSLGITTPQGRAELETRLAYSEDRAKIDFLNVKLAGQTVVSLEGEVCRPLDELTCSLTGKLGPLAGEKIHGFWPGWPALWELSGAINLSSTPQGGKIEVQGKIGQADYALRGDLNATVKPAVFDLDFDLKGLSTAQLKEIKNLKAQSIQGLSPVNARLHVEGKGLPWNPESLLTHLVLEPFRYGEVKVDKVELDLSGNARRQELQAVAAGSFGTVDLKASGHLLPLGETGQGLSGDLKLQTGNLQPAQLGLTKFGGTSLTSRFTGKFRAPANLSLAQASLSGNLEASGRINNRPVQALSASFTLEGRKLSLSKANVQSAGLTASLSGTLTEAGVNVTFNASVSGSGALPLPSGPSFAALTANGTVQGPWKAPQVTLAAQVQKFSFKNITLESASLNGALAGWPPQSGSFKLVGNQLHTPAGTFTRINFNTAGAGGQWQFQAVATSPKEPKFEVAGTADLAARPLTINVARVTWHSQGLAVKNKTPFMVRFLPGWEITPATFQVDGGMVTISGLARDQELAGRLEVQNLDAALFSPLGLAATGKLNGRLTLAGNPRTPIIDGQMALTGGKIKDVSIAALTTTLAYNDNQAQVSGYLEMGNLHSRLVWRGSVPVRVSFTPFEFALAQDGLDLRVQGERVDLSLLTIISKDVQRAEGPLDVMVEARGNPRQPKVSGYLRWSAGTLQLRQAGTPYRLVAGEIRLQGDKIVIPGLILESDGTLRLSGEIVLAGPIRVQTRVQADNFQLLNRGGNDLWTNGAVDVAGPLTALVVKGRLLVPKAQFRPTFFRSGQDPDVILLPLKPAPKSAAAPDLYQAMSIDVAIEAPGNVFLKDPMGQVELTAHLKALKKAGKKLALGGDIRALHGTIDIEEKPFKVERAILTMPGVPGKPILVDVKATHEMDDITLILAVNGTVTNPQIHLESLPPLPPADVLSYLVFGAPAATLSKEQYLALGAQQLGVLGGISTGKISEILGSTLPFLGGIKVKSGLLSGRPTVGVEKEVTKNVSIFAGRNLNEERGTYEQQVGVQYKFNKNLSVESQFGTRNSGADVYFNYDF
jgi:translocation and assembly module TamB